MTTTRVECRIMLVERDIWLDYCCDCTSENYGECPVCMELSESGWDEVICGGSTFEWPAWRWLTEEGLYLGQTFVAEVDVSWHTDYYGECDVDRTVEIISRGPVSNAMISRTVVFLQYKGREWSQEKDRRDARDLMDELVRWRWKSPGRIRKTLTVEEARKRDRLRNRY